MEHQNSLYRRVLLKLSGEALMGKQSFGFDKDASISVGKSIGKLLKAKLQLAIVLGGGNIFRGVHGSHALELPRAQADYAGMLATLINGLLFQQVLAHQNITCHIMSAITGFHFVEPVLWSKAIEYMEQGELVLFVGGTGNPFFTTDTAAALRASEVQADLLLKATKVDGIYDRDPLKDPNAHRFEQLTFDQLLEKNLKVMDATAVTLCRDNNIPIIVSNMVSEEPFLDAIYKGRGTLVKGE